MNVVKENAKTKEEAINGVVQKLNAKVEDVYYNVKEVKGGLFKGTTYECEGFLKSDVVDESLNYLKNIIEALGIEANIEVNTKDNITTLKIFSSNNPIIIGKNGQNLDALTVVVRQFVKNLIPVGAPRIMLDVEDYKDRQIKRIERLAKNLAREVLKTHMDIEMDAMNSYERRAVHNILTDFKNIKTESIGEEPNRRVVIKYVD